MIPVLALCFFAIFFVVLQKTAGEIASKFKIFLSCAAGILLFLAFFKWILPIYTFFTGFLTTGEMAPYFALVIKGMGICFLVSLCTGILKDLGEEGIADKVEMCGKALVLSLSLPILQKILEFIGEMTS